MSTVIWDDYLEKLIDSWKKEDSPSFTTSYLNRLRANALSRIESLRLPTIRDEEWRFTDISSLRNTLFSRASIVSLPSLDSQKSTFLDEPACRLVFVDGQYIPRLSSLTDDDSVTVCGLSELTGVCASKTEQFLGQLADFQDDVFVALNTALMHDGICIVIPANVSTMVPVHILYMTSGKEVAAYPRCLLVAEPGAEVTIVEEYVALQEGASLTNAVTEIYVGESARVNHIRVQREDLQAFHIANNATFVAKAAHYDSVSLALGARISRFDQKITLAGEGAECQIDGLALIAGRQLADTHTFIDHASPHGRSRQLHKCIVDERAHGVFSGEIMVRPHSQQTDARQLNHNLLLSEKARMDTKPQLEIFADDVKCAHGATVGQLDKESLFYLQSRGFAEEVARNLLTYAFGGEIINRVIVASLRQRLEEYILASTRIS
ncbi:Iron-regulated ABC transporter permease protein SufD [Nitrosomonas eutropha]|uniref:Iron-regulated ABC transporter permease protein SufD n=1 Tax=Nitrosomonas eutropha TaxID=916 RepID=A0A1I7FXM3_9PROT|nr:Fe-S cluster assembly protein SufD [Nitrosomonas eutropha]SFU40826.1 Iron-regulated ABC transporter permease protein SufD [Nitrosomonas eutropha]